MYTVHPPGRLNYDKLSSCYHAENTATKLKAKNYNNIHAINLIRCKRVQYQVNIQTENEQNLVFSEDNQRKQRKP